MITDFVVGFSVALNGFLLALFNPQHDVLFLIVFLVGPINDQKIFAVFYVLQGDRIEITLAKGQMINGIKDIGFSNAIRADKTIYFGVVGEGAFRTTGDNLFQALESGSTAGRVVFQGLEKSTESLPCGVSDEGVIKVVASRSHMNSETEEFIAELEKAGRVELVSSGSSLKLCMVAEGCADVYPRIAPTMEWDTAAAQAVVEASGATVVKYDSAVPAASYLTQSAERIELSEDVSSASSAMPHALCSLLYNKENLLNSYFVVSR